MALFMAKLPARALSAALVLLLLLLGFGLFRHPLLTALANYLVVSDPLEKADVIAVLSGAATTRCPKVATLFHDGWAPRIIMTKGYPPAEFEALARYGIHALEFHEQCLAILRFLQVPTSAVEVLDGYNQSTVDEVEKMQRYLQEHGVKRLLLVTSNIHTRRSRLLFRRRLQGTGIEIAVQAADPDFLFDPQAWWTRRLDSKMLLDEYQKLLFYSVRYW